MAKPKELTINDVVYVPKDSIKQSDEPRNSDIKIVILQRGWVFIGRYSENGENAALDNAYSIRIWGTTKGLGQLALEGKTSSTKLDKAGRVEFNKLTVVAMINAKADLWEAELV